MSATPTLRIEEGTCWVLVAYDLGYGIDLEAAQQKFAREAERERILHQRRSPSYLQFRPPPLRIDQEAEALEVAGFATDTRVESTLYDFGAVSVGYRIPISGCSLEDLVPLAGTLFENPTLLADSRRRAASLLERLGDAVARPGLAELAEDYFVFEVRRWQPAESAAVLVDRERELVARVLLGENEPLRASEVEDAHSCRIGYGNRDEVVLDWNGAFVFEAHAADTLAVLEFANVELLEMRFLDDRLDVALERSLEALRAHGSARWWRALIDSPRLDLRRIAGLQMDSALLFEGVNNAIKLLGDQYLARLYRLAARRFHLADWDASILRKLQTLESIYDKLSDEQGTRRMEVLEWIIIVLIAVSTVIPFLVGGAK
ncbi:MAG: hypothetical protein IT458_17435 [Planctomycetes bacterium]|nr:hypothetical protein [Planctomycetota bacterium]